MRCQSGPVVVIAIVMVMGSVAACGQTTSDQLQQAVDLEEKGGDLDAAIRIYEQIVDDPEAGQTYVAQALYRLGTCHLSRKEPDKAVASFRALVRRFPNHEQLVGQAKQHLDQILTIDPATLMPAGTLLYAEVGDPGRQVQRILNMLAGTPLADPLAVLGADDPSDGSPRQTAGPNDRSPAQIIAALLNPSMLKELQKIRGLAIGVTDVTEREPPFVAVLQPGDSDALRGVLTAALQAAGQPQDPIEQMQTVIIERQIACAFDDTVLIAASPPGQLRSCVQRYKGVSKEPSLASASESFRNLAPRRTRQSDALTVWIDPARAFNVLQEQLGQSGEELRLLDYFVDFQKIQGAVGRLGLDEKSPYVEATVVLDEDHRCSAYDLVCTPRISIGALTAVPPQAIAVVSMGLSEADADAPLIEQAGQGALRRVVGLDVGREVFANIQQVTLFVMPPSERAVKHPLAKAISPIAPCLGLAMVSRDPARTGELLDRLLIPIDALSGDDGSEHANVPLSKAPRRYCIAQERGQDIYLHLGQADRFTIAALDGDVLRASLAAARSGESDRTSEAFIEALREDEKLNKIAVVNVGGAIAMLLMHETGVMPSPETGPSAESEAAAFAQIADAFGQTNIELRTWEEPNRLVVRLGVNELPPLDKLFPLLMQLR